MLDSLSLEPWQRCVCLNTPDAALDGKRHCPQLEGTAPVAAGCETPRAGVVTTSGDNFGGSVTFKIFGKTLETLTAE